MKKVLFVCLGNICRSPAAEAVYKSYLETNGISDIEVDSAGTSAYHEGEPADQRMRDHARERGVEITSISRGFKRDDFENFDLIVTMDDSNYNTLVLKATHEDHKNKLTPFCHFLKTRTEKEVPDPYFGGADGFETVLDILKDGMENLHQRLIST